MNFNNISPYYCCTGFLSNICVLGENKRLVGVLQKQQQQKTCTDAKLLCHFQYFLSECGRDSRSSETPNCVLLVIITTLSFLVYSDLVALEDTEAKGDAAVSSDAKLVEEVVKDAETGPQQAEDEMVKQEEESSAAQENEGKEDTSIPPKSEILFSSSTVKVQLIQKDIEESVEEVHDTLDEYVSLFHCFSSSNFNMESRWSKPLDTRINC